jgi:hypothetical protein
LKTPNRKTVNFRIIGRNLPGLRFTRSAGALVDREQVYLGIQRGAQATDLVPGDAPHAVFSFPVEVLASPAGDLDFREPFVHGERGKRFLYLSWGTLGTDGSFAMFRRAKLLLSTIRPVDLIRSLSASPTAPEVEGTVDLTDESGGPVCGRVDPQRLNWRVRGAKG